MVEAGAVVLLAWCFFFLPDLLFFVSDVDLPASAVLVVSVALAGAAAGAAAGVVAAGAAGAGAGAVVCAAAVRAAWLAVDLPTKTCTERTLTSYPHLRTIA